MDPPTEEEEIGHILSSTSTLPNKIHEQKINYTWARYLVQLLCNTSFFFLFSLKKKKEIVEYAELEKSRWNWGKEVNHFKTVPSLRS